MQYFRFGDLITGSPRQSCEDKAIKNAKREIHIQKEENTMIKNITAENFSAEVLESSAPVLVDFWAPWCLPCRLLSPTLDQLAKEQPQLLIAKVNVDEQPELAAKYGVMSIPTLMVVEAGQVKLQQSGLQNKQGILAMLA